MVKVKFTKDPLEKDEAVSGDISSYLKSYVLFLQRLRYSLENRNTNLPSDDLKMYISKLLDPVGFIGGHTGSVQEVENQMRGITSGDFSGGFRIKTIVEKTGDPPGLVSRGKNAELYTILNTSFPIDENMDSLVFPQSSESEWVSLEKKAREWEQRVESVVFSPRDGDSIEMIIGPTEEGLFEVVYRVNQ